MDQQTKDAYHEKMQAQVKEWGAVIDQWKAKADQASADMKIKYQKEVEALKPKHDAAKAKLAEIKASSENAWQHLKSGAENAVSDLKTSFDKAKAQFK